MKKSSVRVALFFWIFIFVFSVCAPITANARHNGDGSSAYRSKINNLDNDKVTNLPIPILFGITLRMITPNFGDARGGGTRLHEGEDIMAPEGAPIVSPTKAVVTRTGTGAGSGKYVSTANPGGETFVYMHLSEILVKNGEELDVGDLIGYVGNTGNASGGAPHLHLEVRDGRKATDPFPRLTREFLLKDKMQFLKDALRKVDDDEEEDLVEFVVKNYQGELWQAKGAGITLPNDIEDTLGGVPATVPSGATAPGDATLGSQGALVAAIQGFLIAKNTGPAAHALASASATGYFGPITQGALIEYQTAHSIILANGYFGPQTRAYIVANE